VVLINTDDLNGKLLRNNLTSKAVKGAALSLEGIDHIHGSDGLSASMLSVGDCIANDVLEEYLEHSTSFLIDKSTDAFHTTSTSETTNGGLGDALNIVSQDLSMALSTTLS
jgi:hypothetical protein